MTTVPSIARALGSVHGVESGCCRVAIDRSYGMSLQCGGAGSQGKRGQECVNDIRNQRLPRKPA